MTATPSPCRFCGKPPTVTGAPPLFRILCRTPATDCIAPSAEGETYDDALRRWEMRPSQGE